MEDSILISTKQILGLDDADDAFDIDIITSINAAFSTLNQLGVPLVHVEDASTLWSEIGLSPALLGMVRAYIPLKVQMQWDPPTLSFLLNMKEKQLEEFEWRIRSSAELETSP